ncbi:MAG TPA: protein-disulfide reductase DsbD family protein, partial [Cyclobacteriaceae bacterium]|nr:protein-disulfide reductase DsbD family protein [Cyclobacteriaceae bacterium]
MRVFLSVLFLCTSILSGAQILKPAKWSYSSVTEANVGDEVELIFKATIDMDWYLYSSEFNCEDGPIKTTFNFVPHASYQLVGNVVAINPTDKYDGIFECDVKIFKEKGEFRQKIKILASPLKITGESDYQVCTE